MKKIPAKKNPNTDWFDLRHYESFKNMSITDWIWQLEVRAYYRELLDKDPTLVDKQPNSLTWLATELTRPPTNLTKPARDSLKYGSEGIKKPSKSGSEDTFKYESGVIKRFSEDAPNESISAAQLAEYPFSTASVNSIKAYEIWSMVKNDQPKFIWTAWNAEQDCYEDAPEDDIGNFHHDPLKYVWDACSDEQDFGWGDPERIANTPIDYHIKNHDFLDSSKMAHVTINLSATDKQIQKDFTHWLRNYRKAINYPSETRLFGQTQKKLNTLIECQAIPYLDLLLVARIRKQKKISDEELGRLLFPDEYHKDTTDRVKKVTKKNAEYIVKNALHKTLSIQLAHENTMKNMRTNAK